MNKMKLFKKVLAVVLVGAMAVSMLTACGSSEVSKVKDALKDAGVTIDSAKMASANKASGALEKATETFKGDAPTEEEAKAVQAELKKMTEFSFNDATGSATTSKYDLYIWTEGKGNTYSYLKKVEAKHVTEQGLKRLLAKNFIKQGEFKGTQSDYDNLKAVLKGVESAGVSIQKVYGVDVLLVVVEKGTAVSNLGATTPAGSGT
jgi:hypothetical protein